MSKKKILYLLFWNLFFFFSFQSVNALDAYVEGSNVRFRKEANNTSDYYDTLTYGTNISLDDKTIYPGTGCDDGWYKINYNEKVGYICSTYVGFPVAVQEDNKEPTTEYQKTLQNLGFPSSYWLALEELHTQYPNWEFEAVKTNVDWTMALNAESVVGTSLISSNNQGYYSTDSSVYNYETDTFRDLESGWYAANRDIIGYYMDPRNWLTESYIFMFEELTYNANIQTKAVIDSIFTTSGYPNALLKTYSDNFIAASSQTIEDISYSISPAHLASRARQELGLSTRSQITGTSTSCYRGVSLAGYYNFYNIGSYKDDYTTSPVTRGLAYASGPECTGCGFGNSYGRPWNTPQKGINGGAMFIINKYFAKGQNTIYFQRFNVVGSSLFSNQYMTNVAAAVSESSITASAYRTNNLLNNAIKFRIPVYLNMSVTSKPNTGNPNNHLKDLTINQTTIPGFIHNTYDYTYYVSPSTTSIELNATTINDKATISGIGSISLNGDTTETKVTVTAENGLTQEYVVKIIKTTNITATANEIITSIGARTDGNYISGLVIGLTATDLVSKINSLASSYVTSANGVTKTTENLATGDIVTISNNITTSNYPIIIYGDNNGDGQITIADLLKIQKQIIGATSLDNIYLKASDVDKDGSVNLKDLLKVQKQILGFDSITQ